MSSLHGFITLNEMNRLKEEDIKEMIQHLADKFKYTSTLLNNLLSWARSQLDGYSVEPTSFNIYNQVDENINVLSHQANEKNITIINETPEDTSVYADKNMINLVILNLLSNAIKFTRNNGEIKINATARDSEVKLCFEDNGIGIPPDKLEVLFEQSNFYTTDGTNDEKGTGLGLMLCSDFVAKNNGKIWAESEEGKGSTFCITLPIDK
ncbi:sensor histidine kinase [Gracilimonas sp.]|uniref:sensor histidine kinase n=1 Tax=Gracilimonas sp. TaxID=1974203 RepID=UPI002871B0B1|nr:HAMP domain-containing sensor histidine kinase [Gracilimonas sp.]